MDARRAEIFVEGLRQAQIDYLLGSGVSVPALIDPTALTVTRGTRHADGRFDYDPHKRPDWLAFEEDQDFVFYPFDCIGEPESPFATAYGRAFALGEENICNPGTYALDGWLSVFPDPLDWLKAGRRGIVILDWSRIFDRLRDCPRILGETRELADQIDTLMHPARLPAIAFRGRKTRSTRGSRA